MAYDIDFVEEGVIKLHINKFFLYPEYWKLPENQISVKLNWQFVQFDEINRSKIPSKKGLYAFTLKPEYSGLFETNYLFYIGKTSRTLRVRFGEYVNDSKGVGKPRKKVFSMLKKYSKYLCFYFTPVEDPNDIDRFENILINTFVPHVNVAVAKAKIKPELQYLYE